VETQTYVIAAAQAGRHNASRESYGHSLIVDPWGDVVARLEDPEATGIAVRHGGGAAAGYRCHWHCGKALWGCSWRIPMPLALR